MYNSRLCTFLWLVVSSVGVFEELDHNQNVAPVISPHHLRCLKQFAVTCSASNTARANCLCLLPVPFMAHSRDLIRRKLEESISPASLTFFSCSERI